MLGRRYPFDPPLTLTGAKQAKSVAKELWDGATVASRLGQRPEVWHDLATVFWVGMIWPLYFGTLNFLNNFFISVPFLHFGSGSGALCQVRRFFRGGLIALHQVLD